MKFIFLCILFIFSLGFGKGECLSNPEKIYSQVSLRALNALEREFGIHGCGAFGKAHDQVELIRVNFIVNQELNRNEARTFIVPIANRLISFLNADDFLRPYMCKYPFDNDNVELTIYFKTKDGEAVFHPNIHVAALKRGMFKYATLDKNDPYPYEEVYTESFSEAQKIVKENSGTH